MNREMRLSELKPNQTNNEEKCDILLQLVDLALDGEEIGSDLSEILLRENNRITVALSDGARNFALMPPEVIRAHAAGRPFPLGISQKWFLIGMFAYSLYYGEDYYARNGLSLLDIDSFLRARTCVIQPDEAKEIPFYAQVSAMTSLDERKRQDSVTAFLMYLEKRVPKKAEVHFMCNGREIRVETYNLTRENYKRPVGRPYFFHKGEKYHLPDALNIQYRPGIYRYEVEVRKGGGR